ncbi:hypothetical protein GCM10023200_19350 [Actinomycetospora chlora]|uniref:Uncharacterized protein n=1 Tax=Actinomycetospora chlora TaxID=663608 RepID=A0ABP9ASA8_9PSEU
MTEAYLGRAVEVHVLDADQPYRIYPEAIDDEAEVSLDRALTEPEQVYWELRRGDTSPRPRLVVAYSGWPELVVFVGGAIVSGVTGNAAYDALKEALRWLQSKTAGSTKKQRLSQEDAVSLARALVKAWDEPKRVRTGTVYQDSNEAWNVDIKKAGIVYTVTIPPGPLDKGRVSVRRRDGRSLLRRSASSLISPLRRTWWRLRYR